MRNITRKDLDAALTRLRVGLLREHRMALYEKTRVLCNTIQAEPELLERMARELSKIK